MTARVVAISMVKDEADVVEGWVLHHLDEVDAMVVADNHSTDGTTQTLRRLAREDRRLHVVHDPDPAYRQSEKMSRLAEWAAAELGAEWIVPVDADELWVQPVDRIATVLPTLGYPIALAELVNHVRTGDDVTDPDPFRSMVWRLEQPQKLGKVAFRWQPGAVIHQGNHGVTLPGGETGGLPVLRVHHFPVRSPGQYRSKARNGAAAYAAAPDVAGGDHWKSWGRMTDEQLEQAYAEHWHYNSPADVGRVRGDGLGLVRDPAPYRRWQTPDPAPAGPD